MSHQEAMYRRVFFASFIFCVLGVEGHSSPPRRQYIWFGSWIRAVEFEGQFIQKVSTRNTHSFKVPLSSC